MKAIRCLLKPGKEKPLLGRHPWVFSGAIDQIEDSYQAGDLIRVYSSEEKFLGTGYFNPESQIAVRMLTFEEEEINDSFFENRIRKAAALRKQFLPPRTDACRLVHSEGDFLPGLIVDRYADFLVLQIQTAGMEKWREGIVKCLLAEVPVRGIYEKPDLEGRKREGLGSRDGVAAGEPPPEFVEIQELGHSFVVDVRKGQKTGFFLDQRDNRKRVGEKAKGRRVLNGFSYTGAFSVYAAKGGAAQTVSVDSSGPALVTAKMNLEKNGLSAKEHTTVEADVFEFLRKDKAGFDFILLDPPAFCKHKTQIQEAARGYKDINLCALKRLKSGGLLFTSSCSSFISADLFQKIIFGAAKDAKKDLRVLAKTGQPFDHPVSIAHPEGEYLKAMLCEVV